MRDILGVLEKMAPPHLVEPWDNPGLQVGSLEDEVERVLVALDPSVEAIRGAIHHRAQLLLTHHPLILKPIASVEASTGPGPVIFESIRKGVSIISLHTNLDAARTGINHVLAKLLGLEELEVLSPLDSDGNTGMGRIGLLPEPTSMKDFFGNVKKAFGIETLRVVNHRDERVRRVAVVGGSGGDFIGVAAEKGAEVLVTGDLKYHQAKEAEGIGLVVIDAGHFALEMSAMGELCATFEGLCREHDLGVEVILFEKERDPFMFV